MIHAMRPLRRVHATASSVRMCMRVAGGCTR